MQQKTFRYLCGFGIMAVFFLEKPSVSQVIYDDESRWQPLKEDVLADSLVRTDKVKSKNKRKVKRSKTKRIGELASTYGLGLGMNMPEIFPIESYYILNEYVTFRGFFVLPIPFDLNVNLPEGQASSKKSGIAIRNPELDIQFDAVYGPQYGVEALFFPFGDELYLSMGLSYRTLNLDGGFTSNVIIMAQATGQAIKTDTEVSLYADATTAQFVTRMNIGWIWKDRTLMGQGFYTNLTLLGLTKPYKAHSQIKINGDVRNPTLKNSAEDEELQAWIQQKEKELEQKALKSMRVVEELSLPIIGISFGILI